MNQEILNDLAQAKEIRRALHQNPEIGFEEKETQALVIEKLKSFGIEDVDTRFAKTGVVVTIKGNQPGPMIGFRADMDALPINEDNDFAYISKNKNKMHGCGHDGHTTILLMTAKYLLKHRDFSGTAVLFFQPAEEGLGGAEKMVVEDKVIEHYPVEAVYALHNWPGIPVGNFAFRSNNIMASSDRIFITIKGKGGHAGLPHLSLDPILVATNIYQAIQGLVSRSFNPLSPVVISITQIHAGDTNNVIADTAKMSGTFRTHDKAVREDLIIKLERLVKYTAEAFGMEAEVKLGPVSHPVTVNTEKETQISILSAQKIVGESKVATNIEPVMGAEDFAYFLEHVPGCYGFIGNGTEGSNGRGLHNTKYDFNDDIIPYGVAYFVEVMNHYSH